jgi:DNA-directed RNA polymerase subunit beta
MPRKKKLSRIDAYQDRLTAVLDVPPLLDIQLKSFKRFIDNGLGEELQAISPIQGYGGRFELEFLPGHRLDAPELPYEECQRLELTYSAPLRVPVRLIDKETGEVKEQEVFMGDIPIMTDYGSFLINGAERVVVSQFVRSPGV